MSADGDRLGQVIGEKWTVERFLGKGSMATVYAVRHRNGARAAMKVLHRNLINDEGAVERFMAEGALANAVEHPGIARALDDGTTGDQCPYIVMELLEGLTLEQLRVARGGYVAPLELMELARRLLDVLVSLHEGKVIHRDLKPTNVFLTNEGKLKLLDFGLARSLLSGARAKSSVFGTVMGTPSFMSPEQALGKRDDVDAQSDVWSTAAILFTLLTGQVVHPAPTIEHRLIAAASKPARSLSSVMPTLDPQIVAVIDKALAFDKKNRWATMREMRDALFPKVEDAALPPMREKVLSIPSFATAPGPVPLKPRAPSEPEQPPRLSADEPRFVRNPFDFGGDDDLAQDELAQDDAPAATAPAVVNVPVANVPVANVPVVNVPVVNVPVANVPVANVPVANVPVVNVPVAPDELAPNEFDADDDFGGATFLDLRPPKISERPDKEKTDSAFGGAPPASSRVSPSSDAPPPKSGTLRYGEPLVPRNLGAPGTAKAAGLAGSGAVKLPAPSPSPVTAAAPSPSPWSPPNRDSPEPELGFAVIPEFPDMSDLLAGPAPDPTPAPPPSAPKVEETRPAAILAPAKPAPTFAKPPGYVGLQPVAKSAQPAVKVASPAASQSAVKAAAPVASQSAVKAAAPVASQSAVRAASLTSALANQAPSAVVKAAGPVALKQVQNAPKQAPQGAGIPIVRVAAAAKAEAARAAPEAPVSTRELAGSAPKLPVVPPPLPPRLPGAPASEPSFPNLDSVEDTPLVPVPARRPASIPPPSDGSAFALPDIALPAVEAQERDSPSVRHAPAATGPVATPRLPISLEQAAAAAASAAHAASGGGRAMAPGAGPSPAGARLSDPGQLGGPRLSDAGQLGGPRLSDSSQPMIIANPDARPMAEPTMLVRQKEPTPPPPAKKSWFVPVLVVILFVLAALGTGGYFLRHRLH